MSPAAIERLMPSTPMRCTLPKLSLISLSCGVALSVTMLAAALDHDASGLAGADADDALHVGEAVDLLAVDGERPDRPA